MIDTQIILTVASVALLALAIFVWTVHVTVNEAERKLGRSISGGEAFFALVFCMAVPFALALIFIYVWMLMPEPKDTGAPK